MDLMTRRRALLAQTQESGVLATATGNPMTFTTDLEHHLHRLVIPFSASELTVVNIQQRGKNLFDKSKAKLYSNVARFIKYGVNTYSDTTPNGDCLLDVGTYTFSISGNGTEYATSLAAYDPDGNRVGLVYNNKVLTFTTTKAGAHLISITFNDAVLWDNYNIQLERGGTPTDFEPFHGTTLPINWQSSAGTILNGTVTLNEDGSADVVNSDTGNSYHLANVGNLTTYLGTNTIWTDTNGTNTAEYWITNS